MKLNLLFILLGEMWVGVALAVLVELVPADVRTTAVAAYFFIISNIGGNMPLLVPPVKKAFMNAGFGEVDSLRSKLYNLNLTVTILLKTILFPLDICRYPLPIFPWGIYFGCLIISRLIGCSAS